MEAQQEPPVVTSVSRSRKILRAISVLAVVVCLLVVLLLFALHSAPARRFAINRVTSLLASHQIELQTDELRYNLFKLSIDLRNVRIRSAASSEAPVFATIGRAQIDLSLRQLLKGRYVVDSGVVDGVDVHYFVDADGRDNLPRPLADPNQPEKPLDYLIAHLTAPNARVHYENRAQGIDLLLPLERVDITGSELTERHRIQFTSGATQLRLQQRHTAVDRVSGDLDLGADDVRVERLAADALGSHAEVSGSVRHFTAPEVAVRLKGDVDAGRTAAFLDVKEPIAGRFAIDAMATGPAASPAVDARVSGSAVQFRSLVADRIDANGAYDPATSVAEITSAKLEAPWGSASASGQIALDTSHRSHLEAALSGIDAATLMHALDLPYAAATRVDGSVRADWPGLEYLQAEGEGHATLTPTAPAAKSVLPLGGRVVVRGSGSAIVARLQDVTAAGTRVSGRVEIDDRRRLSGELTGAVGDVARTASAAEVFLGQRRGTLLPAPVTGPVAIDARLSGSIDAPSATAHISAPSLARRQHARCGADGGRSCRSCDSAD